MPKRKFPILIIILFLTSGFLYSQEEENEKDLTEMSLEELTNLEISVASKTPLTMRKAPGVVTLITKDEILRSGARDLIDVLRLVPGFEFGIDVRGVTSLGVRGNWAHEGKVLLKWDGQIMNELLFQTIQLGNHYPVDLIDRIEVIRGPGSAVYGGNAELSVINIISTPAEELNGALAIPSFGWMAKTYGGETFTFSLARKTDLFDFDFSLYTGKVNRSDREVRDYHPENSFHTFNMAGQSTLNPLFFSTGFNYRGLKARFILDRYYLTDRTIYGINKETVPKHEFDSYIADIQYEWQPAEDMIITPRFTYTQNSPFKCVDQNYSLPIFLDKWDERFYAEATLSYRLSNQFHLLSGIEVYRDAGHAGDSSYFYRNPLKKSISFNNQALFAQGLYQNGIADVTLGLRFENHSEAGTSFVPRFVITKVFDRLHLKALHSYAFRSPGIENISRYSTKKTTPEKTTIYEVEAGYLFSDMISLSVNLFSLQIKDPIVFFVDPVLKVSAYHNGTKTGTRGIESEFRLKTTKFYTQLNYSFYEADGNEVPDYIVLENNKMMLGFPQHKISLNSTYFFNPGLSINVSGTYLSKRYVDNDVTKTQFTEDPKLLMNVFLLYKDIFIKNFNVGTGIYDIFNSGYSFIQPYNGGSSPLPGPSREFIIKFFYQVDIGI